MRGFFKKLNKRSAGFTLAETLICVLILLMVSAIVGAAIPTAANVFTRTVDTANAQILLSTAVTVLRDELSTASDVDAGGTVITYHSGETGPSLIMLETNGAILIYSGRKDSLHETDTNKYDECRKIVSDKAATAGLILKYSSVSDDDKGVVTFTDLAVTKVDSNGVEHTLAGPQNVVIRSIGNSD